MNETAPTETAGSGKDRFHERRDLPLGPCANHLHVLGVEPWEQSHPVQGHVDSPDPADRISSQPENEGDQVARRALRTRETYAADSHTPSRGRYKGVGASAPGQSHGKSNDRPRRDEPVRGHHDSQELIRSRPDFFTHTSPFIGNDACVCSLTPRSLRHPGCCPEGIARTGHEVDGCVLVTNGPSPSVRSCPTIGDTTSACQPRRTPVR